MTQIAGSQTPAGWYPDPGGTGDQCYWDGSAWTGVVQPTAPAGSRPPLGTRPPQPPGWTSPAPPPPRQPRRRRLWAIVLGAIGLAIVLVVAVVVVNRPGPPPLPPPTPISENSAGPTDQGSGGPTDETSSGPTDEASAAPMERNTSGGVTTAYLLSLIGSDASSDQITALDRQCGNNLDRMGNLECPVLGFEITFDPSMRATRVVLYPYQENSMNEYTGELPGGISWSDSYPDVVSKLGEPAEMEGGWGAIDLTAHYQMNGYDVGYGLDTWYNNPDYLQNAHLSSITIKPL